MTNFGRAGSNPTPALHDALAVQQLIDDRIRALGPDLLAGLATQVIPVGSSLPSSPADGQEVLYVPEGGVAWRLRFNASSSSPYKWEAAGATPLTAEVDANEATASAAYTNLATVGPQITVPLAGEYLIGIGAARAYADQAASFARMSYAIGGAAAVDPDRVENRMVNPAQPITSVARPWRAKTVSAGAAIVAKYLANGGGTANFEGRWMAVVPRRVSG